MEFCRNLKCLQVKKFLLSLLHRFFKEYSKMRNDPVAAQKEMNALFSAIDIDKSNEISFTGGNDKV